MDRTWIVLCGMGFHQSARALYSGYVVGVSILLFSCAFTLVSLLFQIKTDESLIKPLGEF